MTRKSSILFQDIRSAIKWMALIFIFCFAHVTVYSQSMIDIDSMGYYLSLMNQNRSHDSALVVKAMDIVDVKLLNDKQFSRADSIVEHFKIRLGNEYYYAFRYDLNCGLVLANQHSKAYRRILSGRAAPGGQTSHRHTRRWAETASAATLR